MSAVAYLSDFVAEFVLIRLAITMPDRAVSPLRERSMESTGSVPLSFIISRGWPSRLPIRDKSRCQGVLTVGIGRAVAYASSLRLEFVLRASLSAFAPSGPTLLFQRL